MNRPPDARDDGPPPHLLDRWAIRPDGPTTPGWMGRVWPVLGPDVERWVVKVTDAQHPPTREADAVLASCLADLGHVPAPEGLPRVADDLRRLAASIRDHRGDAPDEVPGAAIERALDTLDAFGVDESRGPDGSLPLVHYDLHYENVLAAPPGDPRGWVVIDPLPHAGAREVEVVAALRNRLTDAAATGDPDAHLRRRLDRLAEAAGLDRDLARALTQAVAVDNVLWLARRDPDHLHLAAYRVLIRW
ncbi:aminoglycoside phosphotransferase family protein [Intrasporangium sp. YIM S08009]|uniref:aminoglycoside phosphotransferase family protein n=1 Tax=Intrasporangium zincisolvens TaxID=3080018 RepID=UPI002B05F673|nr:aminoglycoside phosphotransferase family protein [Intrasporangium sp. YIM S08009]